MSVDLEERPENPFPFDAGDKIMSLWMTTGSYVVVQSVGDYSFVGVVFGSPDWKVDGTEMVFGFNLNWEPYQP